MLLGMLLKQAFRRLFPSNATAANALMPVTEEDVPSTIRLDDHGIGVPDTTPVDGWSALADRQSYRAAWIRRQAMRLSAASPADLREVAVVNFRDHQRRDQEM